MKKWKSRLFAGGMLLILLMMAGCGDKQDFEAADKVAYEYIASKVERDDDRMKKILTDQGIQYAESTSLLKDGEHLYPGKEDEMGDRYEIVRYDGIGEENTLYYRVKYELTDNNLSESTAEYIMIVKDNEGRWKVTKPVGISNEEKADIFASEEGKEKGITVHEYRESE
ncbi:hypothetical protein [Domibacillus indicus]|uniref:hypothetical protein n=1 Tax=Domibacillus indicus TaxID=1437523 RepID=UPI0006182C9D|nr:hypothetical protein [Domibacillus indicus]